MATPHALLTHAPEQLQIVGRCTSRTRRLGPVRTGFLVTAVAAVTVTVLPGTASAVPGTADEVAAQVAEASHELEVVSEELDEARVVLARHQDEAKAAGEAAAEAEARIGSLDEHIRRLARSAYTGSGITQLDVLLTSGSAEHLVDQLGTLDAIAGHTNAVLGEVSRAAADAERSRDAAEDAAADAERTVERIAAEREKLEAKIADYQRRYKALTASQQEQVAQAHGGTGLAEPTAVAAPSSAAQVAVNTALAQIGDPYVRGAGGPNAFDCSGLTSYAYAAAGVTPPHSSRSQSQMGTPVSRSQLQPGDLVFSYSPEPRRHVHRQRPDGARLDLRSAGEGGEHGLDGRLQQRPADRRVTAAGASQRGAREERTAARKPARGIGG